MIGIKTAITKLKTKKILGIPAMLAVALMVVVVSVVAVSAAVLTMSFSNTVDIVAEGGGGGGGGGTPTAADVSASYTIDNGDSTALTGSVDWGEIYLNHYKTMVITFTNIGGTAATEDITLPGSMPTGCSFTVDNASVSVPAGGTATATVTLTVTGLADVAADVALGDISISGS